MLFDISFCFKARAGGLFDISYCVNVGWDYFTAGVSGVITGYFVTLCWGRVILRLPRDCPVIIVRLPRDSLFFIPYPGGCPADARRMARRTARRTARRISEWRIMSRSRLCANCGSLGRCLVDRGAEGWRSFGGVGAVGGGGGVGGSIDILTFLFIYTLSMVLSSYDSRLSVRRLCPFGIRAVPIPGSVIHKRAIRVHYRLGTRNGFSNAVCAVHCFRRSKGNSLEVRGKAIFRPGSHCLLRGRGFHLCCASTDARARALAIIMRSGFNGSCRVRFDFGSASRRRRFTEDTGGLNDM